MVPLPDVDVVIPVPSYDIVIPEFGAKFFPATATVVPAGPLDGFSVIAATGVVVTVNDADAELDEASVALTV